MTVKELVGRLLRVGKPAEAGGHLGADQGIQPGQGVVLRRARTQVEMRVVGPGVVGVGAVGVGIHKSPLVEHKQAGACWRYRQILGPSAIQAAQQLQAKVLGLLDCCDIAADKGQPLDCPEPLGLFDLGKQ